MSGKVGDDELLKMRANDDIGFPVEVQEAMSDMRCMASWPSVSAGDKKAFARVIRLLRALSASPQDGWVLVPREPTPAMKAAITVTAWRSGSGVLPETIYAAILDALHQPTGDGYTVTSGGSYEIGSGGEIPTDTITCLRCGQKMESKEAAQGCEDPCCPLT